MTILPERRFTILDQQPRLKRLPLPKSVRWAVVEPFRYNIERNHDQTLEELNQRGGLAPEELFAAAHGLTCRAIRTIDRQKAIDWLCEISGESCQ